MGQPTVKTPVNREWFYATVVGRVRKQLRKSFHYNAGVCTDQLKDFEPCEENIDDAVDAVALDTMYWEGLGMFNPVSGKAL